MAAASRGKPRKDLPHRIISTTPVTFRVGGNQGTFIVKLEPLHWARPSL